MINLTRKQTFISLFIVMIAFIIAVFCSFQRSMDARAQEEIDQANFALEAKEMEFARQYEVMKMYKLDYENSMPRNRKLVIQKGTGPILPTKD